MAKYRERRMRIVDAVQWTGDNLEEVKEFIGSDDYYELFLKSEVRIGDYIVLHPDMVFFDVIRADYFEETFEKME